MNLFEIDSRISEIMETAIDPETGEVLDEQLISELDALGLKREEKIENLALFIKSRRAFADAIGGEIASLTARKKTANNEADRAEKYMLAILHGEKFATPKVSISWRRTQAVTIPDATKIPKKFQKITITPDKKEIGAILKAGGKVKGATLTENISVVLR